MISRPPSAASSCEGACLVPPVHLDPEVLDYLSERASARRISLSTLLNTLLRK